MSDVFGTEDQDVELEDQVDNTEGEEESTASKKDPLPEGFLTPVGFTHLLAKPEDEGGRGIEVRPQQVYGYIRNNKSFAEEVASQNTDGRWMLNVEAALAWWDAKEERKAQREAKKAAEAAAADDEDE